jgi:hypothetical protein
MDDHFGHTRRLSAPFSIIDINLLWPHPLKFSHRPFLCSTLSFPVSPSLFEIDFGSEYIKVSLALPGKSVHIVLNSGLAADHFSFKASRNDR